MIVPSVLIAGLHLLMIPIFIFGIIVSYLIGVCINLIPQISLEEGWDRKLIKPVMLIGIFLFGIIPALIFGILVFVLTKQFVWMMLTVAIGMSFVAAILIHVALDVLTRLEFKEAN